MIRRVIAVPRNHIASNLDPQTLANAIPVLQRPPPAFVVQIPLHGAREAFLDRHRGLPAQFGSNTVRINRIACVVSGAILHKGDQFAIGAAAGALCVQNGADGLRQPQVRACLLYTSRCV